MQDDACYSAKAVRMSKIHVTGFTINFLKTTCHKQDYLGSKAYMGVNTLSFHPLVAKVFSKIGSSFPFKHLQL